MSRQFTSGFEGGPGNLLLMGWTATTGTAPTITTTTPHSGTYVLETASGAVQSNVYVATPTVLGEGKLLFPRFYVRGADMTPASATILARATSNGATVAWTITLNTDGTLTLTNVLTSSFQTTVVALSDNTWYRVEVEHFISNTGGDLEMFLYEGNSTTRIDGTSQITDEDTLPSNINRFYVGKLSAVAGTYLFDDVAINDNVNTGDGQNAKPGPGNTWMGVPDFDGSPVAWTPSTGTDHFALVDDAPSITVDDDSTYISTAVSGNEEWFFLTDAPAAVPGNATITLVDVSARAKGNATTPNMRVMFYDGTTRTNGPTATLTTSYAALNMAQHLTVAPSGDLKADTAAYSIAVESLSALDTRVTALWINIEWLESAAINTSITVPTTVYSGA